MEPNFPANPDRPSVKWSLPNAMYFPHELRHAIPDWAGSARCLELTNISGTCSHSWEFGRRVQLSFQVEESGKLSGAFPVHADMDLEAARGLAATLQELVHRVEHMTAGKMTAEERAWTLTHTGAWPEKS